MPLFMFRWQFTAASAKSLVEHPQDRSAAAKKIVADFGGKVHSYYFALGQYDGYAVFEFPDAETAAAASMAASATGGYARMEITQLFTGKEAEAVMKKAKATATSYRPPNQ
jgi:uncharacterized protein with GYD domain